MAFYDYSTPYNSTPDYDFSSHYDVLSTPIQFSSPYDFVEPESNNSPYTYSEPEVLHYEPMDYDYQSFYSDYGYSINEPKHLQYEPLYNDTLVYIPSETKFMISYSTAQFNEPEFEEYDPTPYGGGYDPVTTYGKPIPPSDITCYPRSTPRSDITSLENFTYASIPSPYGKDDDLPIKPSNGSKQDDTKVDSAKNEDEVTSNGANLVEDKDDTVGNGGNKATSDDVDVEIDDELENELENGMRGDYGYESERLGVSQMPYGSGLESMDICESLFGYWPCLAKKAQQEKRKCRFCDQEKMDPWKNAADYLFGSPLVYDYENCHHHHQQVVQYESYENSWMQ
ncbi:hypothetical protein CASFOL_028956 [Castilleja foliolosa]|uniref:Uncharacterized protein n=1 Tax=Castilleja foliolosa TaxID=1961234 RepID=A0ABD3CCN9_9LAMI